MSAMDVNEEKLTSWERSSNDVGGVCVVDGDDLSCLRTGSGLLASLSMPSSRFLLLRVIWRNGEEGGAPLKISRPILSVKDQG
jgi:hypothetical protein